MPAELTPTVSAPLPLERVRRIAFWIRMLALAGAVGLVVLSVGLWSSPAWIADAAARELGLVSLVVTPAMHAAAAAIVLVPVSIGLFALLQVWHLFGHYARGDVFTAGTTARLRRLAWSALLAVVAQVLARTALSLVLTSNRPPGQRALVVSLSANDYLLMLFGVLLLAIAWVMVEATRLAREHSEFV